MPPKKSYNKSIINSNNNNISSSGGNINNNDVKNNTSNSNNNNNNPTTIIPLWLSEGSTQRDKNILCENINIYTPDGKLELIKNSKLQCVAGRKYGKNTYTHTEHTHKFIL